MRDSAQLLRRLNPYCASALEAAVSLAYTRAHAEILPEHWLVKLLEPGDGDLPILVRQYELDMDTIWQGLLAGLERLPHELRGKPGLSNSLLEWMRQAWLIASLQTDEPRIRSAHLLQVLQDNPQFVRTHDAWPLLTLSSVQIERRMSELDRISAESLQAISSTSTPSAAHAQVSTEPDHSDRKPAGSVPPATSEVLQRFAIDLTAKAQAGQIDPVFGRDMEVRQMVDILARRRKNNPILVGDPGVGKTALVEGLALKIASGDVPVSLRSVRLLTLDMGLLQAGAGVKGEFEQRLKNVIDAVQNSPEPILLFVDEAHTLIGAGNSAGGADAANLLKPALARGELRTIAATTWSEYKQYFERDAALERRFQMVKVDEPDDAAACLMLRGLQSRYAQHHGVHIRDDAVVAAVQLSRRYLTGRQLPDKAVDLIDTAAARVRVSLDALPAQIERLQSKLAALETEAGALTSDQASGVTGLEQRLASLDAKRETVQQDLDALQLAHAEQRELVGRIHQLQASGNASPLQTRQTLEDLRNQLSIARRDTQSLVYPEVSADVIAEVVADWTGIPLENLLKDEQAGLLDLERQLADRVIGQNEAIARIAASLRSARTGLRTSDGPSGVFLLAGPSGVGKTETALALSDALFGGERALVTINLSEYQEAHTVSQLKGSPPGYVGYGQGGVLTEAVRQHPYSIVLLDEVEKAHRDVMSLFYQVFDRGFMRDGEGREIDFRNTVILMTSNLGANHIMAMHDDAATLPAWEELEQTVRPVLVDHFQPALLARFQTVLYRPLGHEALREIVGLKLLRIAERVTRHYRTRLTCDDAVHDYIATSCLAPDSGVRNIDHLLNQQLLPAVSQALLQWQRDNGEAPMQIHLQWSEETGEPTLIME